MSSLPEHLTPDEVAEVWRRFAPGQPPGTPIYGLMSFRPDGTLATEADDELDDTLYALVIVEPDGTVRRPTAEENRRMDQSRD